MKILVHNGHKVVRVLEESRDEVNFPIEPTSISRNLVDVAKAFPDELILWCFDRALSYLDLSQLGSVFHHKNVMASYTTQQSLFLPEQLGYIDRTFFLKISKKVRYPTWVMSSTVGGAHASVFNTIGDDLQVASDFEYFLNSLAKLGMDHGLFCYSEPRLFKGSPSNISQNRKTSEFQLFQFVRQHYKWVWVFFLLYCYLIYEKRFVIVPFLYSLRFSKLKPYRSLGNTQIQSTKDVLKNREVDVIIPTIGRKKYLYDVLKDLSTQSIIPKNVIIVEQNPDPTSSSELDYIENEQWPFNIDHTFTHQAGVCNARNIALSKVTSEWTLLGDDDNRFDSDLIESLLDRIVQYGTEVGMTVYLQPQEKQTYLDTAQTGIFGAGNAIIKSELIEDVKFDTRYEFNYGEDTDFGNQLRQLGKDVVFFADVRITHLKAPIGGYRTKVTQKWDQDAVKPLPSPTIQLLYQTYFTKYQILGYKMLLKLRAFKRSKRVNPFSFSARFNKQWDRSIYWASKL